MEVGPPLLGPFQPNPFLFAEAIFGDIGVTLTGAEADIGGFFILAGDDMGKFIPYTEIAGGIGIEGGGGIELGRIDVAGDPSNFKAEYLKGVRNKIWASVDVRAPFSIGGAYSWSTIRLDGGSTITVHATAIQGGLGANPFFSPVAGGWNIGEIKFLKSR